MKAFIFINPEGYRGLSLGKISRKADSRQNVVLHAYQQGDWKITNTLSSTFPSRPVLVLAALKRAGDLAPSNN
jgi:hypothetical protein